MSNPVMDRNPYFQASHTATRPNMYQNQTPSANQYAYSDYQAQYAPEAYQQQAYQQPSTGYAAAADRMTYADAMNKTAALLGTAVVAGVVTAVLLPVGILPAVALGGSLIAFVLGMVIAFKRVVPGALAVGYSVIEGASLGALTQYIDTFLPGVALQTIIATTIIVGVTLALHYSGAVRTSSRGRKFVLIVALGGIIFSFVNLGLTLWGGTNLRTDVSIAGIPLGVLLGIVMLFVAAYMLLADFEAVQYAVANQAPKNFAWTCAIGIVMTILWIYVEVLRIAAILADNR